MTGHHHVHRHGAPSGDAANSRAVGFAAAITGGFMVVEVIGGFLAGSLALVADAGHMMTDFAALAMAWMAFRMARRPADARRSYGFGRLSVLAAFVNGLALFAVAVWISIEAVRRLAEPHPVAGGLMLAVAAAGLVVNVAAFWILSRGDRGNLNLRAALLHVAGDLLGSAAAIVAALVIIGTGWTPIDPILSVFVAVLILYSAAKVVRESAHILLEGTPPGADPAVIAEDLRELHPGSVRGAPPPRLVDHRIPADDHARGDDRPGRRPRPCPQGGQEPPRGTFRFRPRHGRDPWPGRQHRPRTRPRPARELRLSHRSREPMMH